MRVVSLTVCLAAAALRADPTLAINDTAVAEIEKQSEEYWNMILEHTKPGPVVQLKDGSVQGMTDSKTNTDIFWRIPFAAPPVGDLRFAAPAAPQPWNGTRKETRPPRWCPQIHVTKDIFLGTEDCLYLNVFRPAGTAPGEKLPVMVWIYGGAFILGDSSELGWYDGRNLANTQKVMVVSLNYRLNSLGFLALQSLMDEQGTSGLWGLLDQQMALKWVQSNIELLGGDKDRVTIFGQSAGGCSVVGQLSMPSSRGLFHGAIAESPLPGTNIAWPTLENATTWGNLWTAKVGCPQSGAAQLQCLRSKPLKDVLNPLIQSRKGFPDAPAGSLPLLMPIVPWWPAVDGKMLPATPHVLAAKGEIADVPIMIGTVANEGSIFVPVMPLIAGAPYPLSKKGLQTTLRHFFNESTTEAADKVYPPSSGGSILDPLRYSRIFADALRDWIFTCNVRRFVRLMRTAGNRKNDVYLYHFEYDFKGILHRIAGDYHTSELSYVFDNEWLAHIWPVGTWNSDDKKMAAEMGSYWSSFARGSNTVSPLSHVNCTYSDKSACIGWPAYTAGVDGKGADQHMTFKKELVINGALSQEQCDFWDSVGYEGVQP
eukprot:TRINITY_DN211_c0_g1_i2.p1 TRINITY_DN211_c0_g1~~TRINITY_DN211_c0_g1_i2.p1  ORF type:complete len:598 (+),score=195.40 TRINITY_DN211_c0_g1_i2:91-1884(+)